MSLAERDALFSRLCGQPWPFGPLLDTVRVPPSARVLDIGGGEGGLGAELERRGHLGTRHLIDLKSGTDAHALPFGDASFGAVSMLRLLGHLHAPALALAEAWRVLRRAGVWSSPHMARSIWPGCSKRAWPEQFHATFPECRSSRSRCPGESR